MKLPSFLKPSSRPAAAGMTKTKVLVMFLLMNLLNSCVIEGDKDRPAWLGEPCGEIQINPQNCGFLSNHEMSVQFTIDPTSNPDLCDSTVPIDLGMNIDQSANNPIVSWTITGVNQQWQTINFSSTNPVAQDATDIGSYVFTGSIVYGNNFTNNTSPSPVIDVTTYETTSTTAPGYQLDVSGYQPSCAYVVTPPTCETHYKAYCHTVPGAPEDGIATYKFDICYPLSMRGRFAVWWFSLQPGSNIRYVLKNAAWNIVSDQRAAQGIDSPVTFPNQGEYSLEIYYRATGPIPIGWNNHFTDFHIPGTLYVNTTANFHFWQKIHGLTWDQDCSN